MLAPLARTVVRLLPEGAATRLSIALAELAFRAPLKPRDQEALDRGLLHRWGPGEQFYAWQWGESGPLVVLIHGWGGRAAQMAPLAEYLAAQGYRCVAPDMRAHGASPGRRIRFAHFIDDLPLLLKQLGDPVHALIGHSAGAMTMMRSRQVHGVGAACYVSINGPRAPYPPVEQLGLQLNPGRRVLDLCKPYFAGQFGDDYEALDDGRVYRYAGHGRLLAIHDEEDEQVRSTDAELVTRSWPTGSSQTTQGLGHQRVLYDAGVHQRIGEFLEQPLPSTPSESNAAQAESAAS